MHDVVPTSEKLAAHVARLQDLHATRPDIVSAVAIAPGAEFATAVEPMHTRTLSALPVVENDQ